MSAILGILATHQPLNGSSHLFPPSESASLQMAHDNQGFDTAAFSRIAATGVTETLFGSAQALIVMVDVPWDRYGQSQTEFHHILGNDYRGTPIGGGFHLRVDGPREDATARTVVFTIRNQAETEHRTGTVTLTGRPKRLLICISSDGSDLDMRVYSDGVANGSVAWSGGLTAFGGTTLDMNGFLIGCTGAGGGAALTPFAGGQTRGFDGSISFLGLYSGTLSNADLAAMSGGRAPEAVLPTGANWLLGRELTDYAADSFEAAAWATGDDAGAWTASGTFLPGSTLTPSRDGSGNTFALDPIPGGCVWGLAPGQTTAAVPLSFTASGITGGVEARLVDAVTGAVLSDWATVSGVDLGTTTGGTIAWPECTGGWAYVDARPVSDASLVQRSRAHCAVGWVIGIVGQSNAEFPFKSGAATSYTPGRSGNVSTCMRFRNGTASNGSFVIDRVTAAAGKSNGLKAWLDEAPTFGDTPVMMFDMMMAGTGGDQLLDDSNSARLWSDAPGELIDRLGHGLVSAWVIAWALWVRADTRERLEALIEGDATGVSFAVDHYLWDTADFPNGSNAGICLSPEIFGKEATGASRDHDRRWPDVLVSADTKTNLYNFQAQEYAAGKGAGWHFGTDKTDAEMDGGHADTEQGQTRIARRLLIDGMRACGVDTRANPRFTGVTMNGAGTEITATFSLPNGGSLRVAGATTGSPTGADANAVQGFELLDPATGGGTPTRSGFTAEILDAAAGTVRLTKSSGSWSRGTLVHYVPGRGMDYGQDFYDHELHRGRLYDGSPYEGGLGLPALCGDAWMVPLTLASDLPAALIVDPSALGDMIQERDGNFGAGTAVAVGDRVGSIRNQGTAGGYLFAPSNGARPTLRQLATWPYDDAYAYHYMDRGPIYYLEFDHASSQEMQFSGSAVLPNSDQWAFGIAVALRSQDAQRRVIFCQSDTDFGAGGNVNLMHNVATGNGLSLAGGGIALRVDGSSGAGPTGYIPAAVGASGDWPRTVVANIASGPGAAALYRDRSVPLGTWTADTVVDQVTFRLGHPVVGSFGHGSFNLYRLVVCDATLSPTQLRQMQGYVQESHAVMPPLWV